jgi:C-terminal processing protease CtpA/Prc
VLVPPGKLGVILVNRHDGKGTVVSEIRDHSSLKGMLVSPGDKLVAVDGEDVLTGMVVSQNTSLMD